MTLIKDKFVNLLDDIIWEVLLPKEKEQELVETMGKMAADLAKVSLGKKVDLLKTKILQLFQTKIDSCEDEISDWLLSHYPIFTNKPAMKLAKDITQIIKDKVERE